MNYSQKNGSDMKTLQPTTQHELFYPFIDDAVFSVAEIHAAERIVDRVFSTVDVAPTFMDYLAVAIAVWAPRNGHVCANLDTIADRVMRDTSRDSDTISPSAIEWPEISSWIQHLADGPLVAKAHNDSYDLTRPLVLFGSQLYLTRQWIDEGDVASSLRTRFQLDRPQAPTYTQSDLDAIFHDTLTDEQSHAVLNALRHNTTVLLGGPGTGKTYTITAMLHMLLREHEITNGESANPLAVALAAPTAKAAKQISDSIAGTTDLALFPNEYKDLLTQIGSRASTIHRLLGTDPSNPGRFRHNRHHKLPYKVIIIDEVSMVSLSLMARLLEALSPDTQLILVGDGEQLKSVENGAVLPEIAELRDSSHRFPITTLTTNQRQMNAHGELNDIGKLAQFMRHPETSATSGNYMDEIFAFLREHSEHVTWIELSNDDPDPLNRHDVLNRLHEDLSPFAEARNFAYSGNSAEALLVLSKVRILCGHRRGMYGVTEWNKAISQVFNIPMDRTAIGLPLLNTKNDLRSGLVNGDTGIVVLQNQSPVAVFSAASETVINEDGQQSTETTLREFEPTSLGNVEVSFATTVHKAQGSQYPTAIVVCPPESSPLATRELIYTAVTRAQQNLVLIASPNALQKAIESRTTRDSALAERIRAGS